MDVVNELWLSPIHVMEYVTLKQQNYKADEDVTDVDNEVIESMEIRSVLMPAQAFPVVRKLGFFQKRAIG